MTEVTILISTSPRPSHPSPRILDQVVLHLRSYLPGSPIIIMADGPVETDDYTLFLNKISGRYLDSGIQAYHSHVHQSGMLEKALDAVKTPLVLYMEDDWQLMNTIEFVELRQIIQSGYANYIRLYSEARVHPLREHMMLDRVIEQGIPLIKTIQWSQNPHLASTEFYRNHILPHCLGRTDYIENLMHGLTSNSPWETYRLCIYNGTHDATMQRVHHLDGKK